MPIVNTGQTANDGTGDTLREAFRLIEQRLNDIIGITEQITWSTGLAVQATPVRQWTVQSGQAYAAASNHTAGASFAADLAAGRWVSVDALALASRLDDLELSAPARDGTGATGTWDISISGSAASAASADNCARSVSAAGLASGGGTLSADRTITVPKASQAQAEAGADDATAMTPLRTSQAIAALAPSAGAGQVWQDVIALRVDDTTYQNITGRQITVAVSMDDLSGNNRMYAYASINASAWILVQTSMSSEAARGSVCFPVPNGHYYRVNTSAAIAAWAELR